MGFPCDSAGNKSFCNAGDLGLIPRLEIPWRRKWQCTPLFLPGESHGQKSHGVTKRVRLASVTKNKTEPLSAS